MKVLSQINLNDSEREAEPESGSQLPTLNRPSNYR